MEAKLDIHKWVGALPLKGDKVLVRPFLESDLSDVYISWLNDPEVVRFSNQRFVKHDIASVRDYYESFSGSSNALFAIEDVQTQLHVGTMTAYVQPYHGTVDVGILMGLRGNGFGKEAWRLVIDWLLDTCHARKVTAGTLSCNHGMIRLMELAGMHQEATRAAQEVVEGKPQDIVYYAKFNDV